MVSIDPIDRRILAELQKEGRISVIELAERVGLSPTPCGRRLKRLEESGVIVGYGARVDPQALGLNVAVLIAVRLSRIGTQGTAEFLDAVNRRPEITECMLVTGNNIDYMLKVQVHGIDELATFIRDVLQTIPSVGETSTMVILKSIRK